MGTDRDDETSPDALLAEMDVLEPYTTDEVAAMVDGPTSRIRALLDRLASAGRVRKKAPAEGGLLWIKAPPSLECPACGQAAEIRFLHPVLASARYCPRCGAEL
jgi:rubredoxin